MILTGRALEPDDDRSEEERKQEATNFLKYQGILSALSLLGLTIFAVYPNIPVGITCVITLYTMARYLNARGQHMERISARNRAVLITGCDAGFGYDLAKQLSSLDVTVFAGFLHSTADGCTSLKAHNPDRIHVIQLDVTRNDQIETAVGYVNKVTENKGLWGLVTIPPLQCLGDVEITTVEQFETLTNVNQLGVVRVIKAFLPLIRRQKGRIVNVTSVRGRLSSVYNAAYNMTMFAVEALSDCLRQELKKFGVQTVVIEPGNFTHSLNIKRINADVRAMWRSMSKEARSTYGKEYVEYHVDAAKHVIEAANDDNRLVNDVIEEALFTVQPNIRYMIGGSNTWYDKYKLRARLVHFLPEWFLDGLELHDVRNYPTPEALIGQEDH